MTPTLEFRGQPFHDADTLGAFIERATSDARITEITVAVAWARFRGLARVRPAIERFRARGGRLRIIVGIDEGGATRPGLLLCAQLATEAYVFHEPNGWTFHPKIYLAEGESRALLLVGSNNATPGGLFGNYEAALEAKFSLPEEELEPALIAAREYLRRLRDEEELCKPLDEDLVDALMADARFHVAGDERSHQRSRSAPAEKDQSGSNGVEVGTSPFGKRRSTRAALPLLPNGAVQHLAELELPHRGARWASGSEAMSSEPRTGAPAISVVESWTKELPRGDAQRTKPGTNPTGNLRLTQAGHPISWTTWFRRNLFGPATWRDDVDRRGNAIERADVPMEVFIDGRSVGVLTFKITHAPHRESEQANHTTALHWGPLAQALKNNDYTGYTLMLARMSDGSYRLSLDR